MAAIYYVKDGPRPGNAPFGRHVRLNDIERILTQKGLAIRHLGAEPPQFNVANPSKYPVRVVIEVETGDATSAMFPAAGFYVIPDISPDDAEKMFQGAIGGVRL